MREFVRRQLMEARMAALPDDAVPPRDLRELEQLLVPLPSASVERAGIVQLAGVEPKTIRWLWPGHIPYGALTLVIGDPGLGKSQLTLDLAARITTGARWPDGPESEIGNVLLVSSEDSVERTVVPRLKAAGADLERIVSLSEVTENGKARMFSLKSDLSLLEAAVEKQYIDLVVIDPLNGFIGDTNSWKESEVRNVLGPACVMADKHDVALIGVIHLNKDNTRSAIHRVLGSVAFSAVTRSMFAVAPHPSAPRMRYFVSVKQNYTAPPPTLGFTMMEGGGIIWDGLTYSKITADSILAAGGLPEEKAERRNAREFLSKLLADGEVSTKDIRREAARSLISNQALYRAKYDLKVQSVHVGSPSGTGKGGYWMWRLPS